MMIAQELLDKLLNAEKGIVAREKPDRPALIVPATELVAVMTQLKNNADYGFDMLCDLTAIDWIAQNQFEVVYQLHSTTKNHKMMVGCRVPRDNPQVPSVCSLWAIAEWQEREVYDMFGILFENHPDLRRVLLDDDWQGFPLRKDYKDEFMLERPEWA